MQNNKPSSYYLKNLRFIRLFLKNQGIKSTIHYPDLEKEEDFLPYLTSGEGKGAFAWYEELEHFHKFFVQTKKETNEYLNCNLLELLREISLILKNENCRRCTETSARKSRL